MSVDTHSPAAGAPTAYTFDEFVERYLNYLRSVDYAPSTLRKKRQVIAAFAQWIRSEKPVMTVLKDQDIEAFSSCLYRAGPYRLSFVRRTLTHLFRYLRTQTEFAMPTISANVDSRADELLRAYIQFLRSDRGLTECSVRVYSPFVRAFLSERAVGINVDAADWFSAAAIRSFLLDHARNHSSEYSRLLAIALRSFCRFLFIHGHIERDLSVCVPTVRRWRHAEIPAFLTPEQVERMLATTDRPTSSGRRNRAILLLLARLGLRPGEVAALELDDLHWRTGEITIHGRGRAVQCLPLLPDVGEALAAYLREDRGICRSRRVFLREKAPCGELAGPGAIGQIVCQALARAGIERTSRGAAHLLRHGLATQMIRHGASLSQIAEVLRHRTENTTAIYTKVSCEALRAVAKPWPVPGDM